MQYDDLTQISLTQLVEAKNWQSQYRLITQWGKLLAIKPEMRVAENLVKGCEASAWMSYQLMQDQRYHFMFDSDSRVIKGLAALLLSLIDNKTAEQLAQLNLTHILRDAGLEKHLTPSRNNGFRAMILRVYELTKVSPSLS